MSVAIHELTHFVSLNNALGHMLGFLALDMNRLANGIEQNAETGQPIPGWWLKDYVDHYRDYRILLEIWRPFLEGIAVYSQLHRPNEAEDALLDPLQVLVAWGAFTAAVGARPAVQVTVVKDAVDALFEAAYSAIRAGPSLPHGNGPLAAGLEFVEQEGMRPYFLGHAYLRALQGAFAQKCAIFELSEPFFNLVMRILATSTRAILGTLTEGHHAIPNLIYGWLNIVRAAPARRVAALHGQPHYVDVLYFLETGEKRPGYDLAGGSPAEMIRDILPQRWERFQASFDEKSTTKLHGGTPFERARWLLDGWIGATGAINLSSNGEVFGIGWVPHAFDSHHAMALQMENHVWWVALADADLALLLGDSEPLPKLDPSAMLAQFNGAGRSHRWLIDSYARYVSDAIKPGDVPDLRPRITFRLRNAAKPDAVLHLETAGARAGVGPHLRVVDEKAAERITQGIAFFENRQNIRDTLTPTELDDLLQGYGLDKHAATLRWLVNGESLAIARAVANVERRILAALLEHEPAGADLDFLDHGALAFPEIKKFSSVIAKTYAAPVRPDKATALEIRAINVAGARLYGKAPFEFDGKGLVRYCGLWGHTVPQPAMGK